MPPSRCTIFNTYAKLQTRRTTEDNFYNQIQVVALALTTESIELCYDWSTKSESSDIIQYFGQAVGCWNPNSKSSADYKDARRRIYNALEWITTKNRAWITADLSKIEKHFDLTRSLESARRAQMTPPAAFPDLGVPTRENGEPHKCAKNQDLVSRA